MVVFCSKKACQSHRLTGKHSPSGGTDAQDLGLQPYLLLIGVVQPNEFR